jgi:putative Mg2+ transporter-C (MgtC) family protein
VEGTGSVEVTANFHSVSRNDGTLEQIVGRLSLESSVTAARWRVQEVAE